MMTVKMKEGFEVDGMKIGKVTSRKVWPLMTSQETRNCLGRIRLHALNRSGPRAASKSRSFLRAALENPADPIDRNPNETFHCAIGPILIIAQVFGLFPVMGISSPSPKNLAYSRRSARTIYSLIVIISIAVMAGFSIMHMLKTLKAEAFELKGGITSATSGAVFYGNSLIGAVIFLWLAPHWVVLQQDWRAMERLINRLGHPKLRWKFKIITGIVLLLALIEHLVSIVTNTIGFTYEKTENSTIEHFLHFYSATSHPFILSSLDYNIALGIFLFIISKFATFVWNFTDIFVMLISTGLAEWYKTLNESLISTIGCHKTLSEWQALREYYASLSLLVKQVDTYISPIILLSFANNLYFICLQLLNGLYPTDNGLLSNLYYFGSFVFMVTRTVTVTLLVARINDQSKLALPVLYNCPASTYCMEAQRLQQQLSSDDIALTGLRFFSVTRNFMLAVAGAIATYELVLLQFNVAMNK
ncbi:Gustatory receptor 2 [Cephus cinctus]|uniref:Gustatory receptor for sugar taste 64f isoform X2 n=1 Tax=Cephus cinctus TaxID=211228 RepID=A0A3L9LU01_CEPCN|nr:gustatory receptor for sugar taste 64f isoform X2 [Cephus cinctus]RLZ02212.1 Gustatory receptor 2 [Cephus cinctus]